MCPQSSRRCFQVVYYFIGVLIGVNPPDDTPRHPSVLIGPLFYGSFIIGVKPLDGTPRHASALIGLFRGGFMIGVKPLDDTPRHPSGLILYTCFEFFFPVAGKSLDNTPRLSRSSVKQGQLKRGEQG